MQNERVMNIFMYICMQASLMAVEQKVSDESGFEIGTNI